MIPLLLWLPPLLLGRLLLRLLGLSLPAILHERLLRQRRGGSFGGMLSSGLTIIANVPPDVEGYQYNYCDQDGYIQVMENGTER